MNKQLSYIIILAAILLSAVSCSTTRILSDGQYRLAENTIEVKKGEKFNTNQLVPYIKQKAKAWSPMLCVYNWAGQNDKSIWNKFVKKIGIAPVIYNPDLVTSSVENIKHHLDYIGYYNSDVNAKVEVSRRKVKVKYMIDLGKRYPIESLNFALPEGNPEFDSIFRRLISSKIIYPHLQYSRIRF